MPEITRIDVTDAYYGHPFGTGAVLDMIKGSPSGPMGAQLRFSLGWPGQLAELASSQLTRLAATASVLMTVHIWLCIWAYGLLCATGERTHAGLTAR